MRVRIAPTWREEGVIQRRSRQCLSGMKSVSRDRPPATMQIVAKPAFAKPPVYVYSVSANRYWVCGGVQAV